MTPLAKDSRVCPYWLRGLECRGCQACKLYRVSPRAALSQDFEPGSNPYDSAGEYRGTMFGQTREAFHADEALFSIADDEIRRAMKVAPAEHYETGERAVRYASYSAIAVEEDREAS